MFKILVLGQQMYNMGSVNIIYYNLFFINFDLINQKFRIISILNIRFNSVESIKKFFFIFGNCKVKEVNSIFVIK